MRILAIAAIAVIVASPALAGHKKRHAHHRHAQHVLVQPGPRYQPQYGEFVYGDTNPNNVYVDGGRYVGSDPDPNVRMRLRDDYYMSRGGR